MPRTPRTRKKIDTGIDLKIPGVGRFQKRSGATTMEEHYARVALLKRLIELGQLDAIRRLMSKDKTQRVTFEYLRQQERQGRLGHDALVDDFKLMAGLWDAVDRTLPMLGRKATTRDSYLHAFARLRRHADPAFLPKGATVADLKTTNWLGVWDSMGDLSPATRNRVRQAVSTFLSRYLGDKWHPFRRGVLTAMMALEHEAKVPKDLTISEFWTNHNALPELIQPIAVALVVSNMRIGEFLRCTAFSVSRLETHGYIYAPDGKGGDAEVMVDPEWQEDVLAALPCRIAEVPAVHGQVIHDRRYRIIRQAFLKATKQTGIPWSPHYLRHMYCAEAMEEFSQVAVQHSMRHKTAKMVERYAARKNNSRVALGVGRRLAAGRPVVLPFTGIDGNTKKSGTG